MLDPINDIWLGAAYIRMGYNSGGSNFDLPAVGSAYNSGDRPKQNDASPFRLRYFGEYVEIAAPMANAAASVFNQAEATTPPPLVLPLVRFMR